MTDRLSGGVRVFWRRMLQGGLPLLVTVSIHALVVIVAGVWVVHETRQQETTRFAPTGRPKASDQEREVEHRLQVARKSGGSASASPVSAQRILSSSSQALSLPALPELPSSGASLFGGGFSGVGSGVGVGQGSGMATGLSRGGLGGKGFVSLTFLGMTNVAVRNVVFAVDVSRDLMDIRKGGFKAFAIIRDEMVRLVSQLPPGAEFGVVLYGGATNDLNLFRPTLAPATLGNKEAFFNWIRTVNTDPDRLGTRSAGGHIPWKEKPGESLGLDASLMVPNWVKAVRAALEMKAETVFLVTGSAATGLKQRSEERLGVLEQRNAAYKDRLRRGGVDPEAVARARGAALAKARKQLQEINDQLKAQGKSPFIVTETKRVFQPDFQAALKRAGFAIELDTTGWADPQGKPIWELGVSQNEKVEFTAILNYVARLQAGLLKQRAEIHAFLFVGPDEKPKDPLENLTALVKRNGGKFELLTGKRLEELAEARSGQERSAQIKKP